MAEAQLFKCHDEYSCLVCLDTLIDPVSLSCGHSFCLKCLNNLWNQDQVCSCPECGETFTTRPELHINTVLNEDIKNLKQKAMGPSPSQNYDGHGVMECYMCTGKKFRAVKTCLTCMASFCQIHLKPHLKRAACKDHKLTDPKGNLQEKLCVKHKKRLEIFCRTDETCICAICVMTGHKGHEVVELEAKREEKQRQLRTTLSDIGWRLDKSKKELRKMRKAVDKMKISVQNEVQEHKKSFSDLICSIEEIQRKLIVRIKEQEKMEMEKAKRILDELEKEIKELKSKDTELKEILRIKEDIHFLKTFSSRCVLPASGDSLTVTASFSSDDLRKELSCLKKKLEKISQWDIVTWNPSGGKAPVFILQPPEPRSRDDFLQYFCPLTPDMNTAHRDLRLSEGNKVTRERIEAKYPDHPDRFDYCPQGLCIEALTGTRHYWEVECSGDNVLIGVAYTGLSRKGEGRECSLGFNDKSWCLQCFNSQYFVYYDSQQMAISAPYSPRIGVYLDWPDGSLSFYSVSHTMTLLHRFNTSFTEPLYPGIGLDYDCSVTICPLTPGDH